MQELVAFTMQVDSDLNMIHWIEFFLIYWISLTDLRWNSECIALSKIWSKSWMLKSLWNVLKSLWNLWKSQILANGEKKRTLQSEYAL